MDEAASAATVRSATSISAILDLVAPKTRSPPARRPDLANLGRLFATESLPVTAAAIDET